MAMGYAALDALPGIPPVLCGLGELGAEWATRTEPFQAASTVLVVDEAVVVNGYLDRLRESIDDRAVSTHVVALGEPSSDSVEAAARAVRAADRPLVVAVGGGSALDTAKLAAAVAGDELDVEHYALGAHPLPTGRPVVAVPTTAGTGSEVTRTCVLTARDGRKVWVWDDALLPRLVVLDPAATATMPAELTATTGLDAFVHAVEAVTGRRAGPAVTAPALGAVSLVLGNLPAAVADGDDLDARRAMQQAATLAGAAIDAGGTGVAHAIGHALGTLAGVPHGAAVAVGLASALRWNVEAAPAAFAPMADSVHRSAAELGDVYDELLAASRFDAAVRRIGPLPLEAGQLAATIGATENAPMCDNNCRRVGSEDRGHLAERTLQTWAWLLGGATS